MHRRASYVGLAPTTLRNESGGGGEGGYPASHSETSETRTDDGIKHVGVQTRRYHLRGAFDALHNIWTAA